MFYKITCNYSSTFACEPYVCLLSFAGKWQYLCEMRAQKSPLSVFRMIGDRVYSSGGMIPIGDSRCTGRRACPTSELSNTNPTWNAIGLKLCLHDGKLANNRLSTIITYVHTYIHIYAYIRKYIHTYLHTYIHTYYIHTYTHIHT